MKIGLVYTSTTKELEDVVKKELALQFEEDVQIVSLHDASILNDAVSAGYVTAKAAAKLFTLYMDAIKEGCDAILNICSSVGEAADSMQDAAAYMGIPIVRIDEEMCREAVRKGERIGVMATLPTTLKPTINTILRMSRECEKPVEIEECLVEGAFGTDQETFRELLSEYAKELKDKVDIIVLAQGSMAYCEEYLARTCGCTVLSSPRFGAAELKKALQKKGCI